MIIPLRVSNPICICKTMKHRALRVQMKWMWKSGMRLWKSQVGDGDGLDSHRVAERNVEAWGCLGMGWNTHVQTTCARYLLRSLLGIIPRTAGSATSYTLLSCSSVPIPSLSQPPWSSLSLKCKSCALGSSFTWPEITPATIFNTFRVLLFDVLLVCINDQVLSNVMPSTQPWKSFLPLCSK